MSDCGLAIVSHEMNMMIALTFHCKAKTIWGFWNVKFYFFFTLYSTTLRQWTSFLFLFSPTLNIAHIAVPWSLKAQHFSARNSHWDQSPEIEMQRICFIGQLQPNKSKYVFWSCLCASHIQGEWEWLYDINNIAVAWYEVTCLHTWT